MYITQKKSNMYDYRDGDIAAYYGYLSVLQNNYHLIFTTDAMNWASYNDHFETAKWLHKNTNKHRIPTMIIQARNGGKTEIVKWLQQHFS
jgi:hypothetical protein